VNDWKRVVIMNPISQTCTPQRLESWLQEARAGSKEALDNVLAVCRNCLFELADVEMAARPGQEAEIRKLAGRAGVEVERLWPQFQGSSEVELRSWLRRILLDQTLDLSESSLAHRLDQNLPRFEGFDIAAEIARGGMGIVYRAWQQRMQRWVAIKCLPPDFAGDPERLRRFRPEAPLARQRPHHATLQALVCFLRP